jgi:arylsulfatase A-like enzyme
MLKAEGYATGIFGKWHLGDNYPCRPGDQGFDESLIHLTGGMAQPGDITTYLRNDSAYFDPVLWHNGKQQKYKGYCSDIFASNAAGFIERNSRKPFFCYLAFNAPHTPLQVPDAYYNMYRNTDPSSGFSGSSVPEMTDKDKEDARRVYAMVTNIDDNVGKVLKKVDEAGIAKNTIVIFMTDNGPQQRRYVAGMRGLKGSVFRGGVRVPFLIRYPEGKVTDRDINYTSAHIDVLPTVAELCGAKVAADRKIDGRSMVPFLKGMSLPEDDRALFFYWTRRNPEKYNNIALMKGKYRLVGQTDHHARAEDFQLFDIAADPSEKENVVMLNRETAAAMKFLLDSVLADLTSSRNMIEPPYISIGTRYENPVFLNRNDAWGEREVWEQEEVYGVWRVDVAKGHYKIRYRFKNPVPPKGRMVVDLKSLSFQQKNSEAGLNSIEMKNLELPGGKCEFYPYYEVAGKRILPLWVEIERID